MVQAVTGCRSNLRRLGFRTMVDHHDFCLLFVLSLFGVSFGPELCLTFQSQGIVFRVRYPILPHIFYFRCRMLTLSPRRSDANSRDSVSAEANKHPRIQRPRVLLREQHGECTNACRFSKSAFPPLHMQLHAILRTCACSEHRPKKTFSFRARYCLFSFGFLLPFVLSHYPPAHFQPVFRLIQLGHCLVSIVNAPRSVNIRYHQLLTCAKLRHA